MYACSVIAAGHCTQTRKEHLYFYFHNSLQVYGGLEHQSVREIAIFLNELVIILKARLLSWLLNVWAVQVNPDTTAAKTFSLVSAFFPTKQINKR